MRLCSHSVVQPCVLMVSVAPSHSFPCRPLNNDWPSMGVGLAIRGPTAQTPPLVAATARNVPSLTMRGWLQLPPWYPPSRSSASATTPHASPMCAAGPMAPPPWPLHQPMRFTVTLSPLIPVCLVPMPRPRVPRVPGSKNSVSTSSPSPRRLVLRGPTRHIRPRML